MNTKHISLAFAAAAALLAGCAKSPIETPSGTNGLTDLELTYVGSTEVKSVIDGTTFPTDGEIGLFLFGDEQATKAYGDGYENIKYAYNSTKKKWTANPSIKVGSTPGYLYGYYPYNSESTDVKEIPVASSLNGDDVMYASQVKNVIDKTASQTAITMNHALARVTITVTNNGYTGKAELSKIKFSGAKIAQEGTLNALDGKITATNSDVTLDVPTANQTITATGSTYECLLVPSGKDESKQTVDLTLTIDDKDMTATLSGDNGVIIAQNTKSNITITLSNKGISVQTVSIKDWNVVEVGGHKVTVKFSEVVVPNDILSDIHIEGQSVIIKATSIQKSFLSCNVGDDAQCQRVKDNDIYTFTISDISSNVEAVLSYSIVTITVSSDSNGKAWIGDDESKTSGTFYSGQQVVIHAAPNDKFRLYRWNDNNRENSRTFTVVGEDDAEYSASFISSDLIPGLFTVNSSGKQVFFSKGNLYCSGAEFNDDGTVKSMTNARWGFEANQYETTPNGNRDNNHISHFMWCDKAEKAIALKYNSNWNGEEPFFAEKDFTVNGVSTWRTLTGGVNGEWKYLINKDNEYGQTIRSGKYMYGVKVCVSANCLILLPDDWKWGENGVGSGWLSEYNESTTVKWSTMENAGAVCLPAAGYRNGDVGSANVVRVGTHGYYWSSTPNAINAACLLYFDSCSIYPADGDGRSHASTVRLVTEYQSEPSAE